MAKKLLGLVLAILMAVPTTSFAQEDAQKSHAADVSGTRVRLALANHDSITATLLSVDDLGVVVRDVDFGRRPMTFRSAPDWGNAASRMAAADIVGVVLRSRKPVAQSSTGGPEPALVRRVVGQLTPGTTIDVRTLDGRHRRARLVGTEADGFHIAQRRGIATVAYADVTAVGPAGMSGLKKGILTGLGIYTVIGTIALLMLESQL